MTNFNMSTGISPVARFFTGALLVVAIPCFAQFPADVPTKTAPAVSRLGPVFAQSASRSPVAVRPADQPQPAAQQAERVVNRHSGGCPPDSGSLCYDYRSGRVVYKPMRLLLPAIPGMTPENLAVHRDKIVAQYTFK
jgi:hypothetical protein